MAHILLEYNRTKEEMLNTVLRYNDDNTKSDSYLRLPPAPYLWTIYLMLPIVTYVTYRYFCEPQC